MVEGVFGLRRCANIGRPRNRRACQIWISPKLPDFLKRRSSPTHQQARSSCLHRIKSKYVRCSLVGESPGRPKMDSSEDGTEKTDYLFVSGTDRSYAGKVRAHVLRGYMSHRRRHAKAFKSAGSTPKPLRDPPECLDAGMSVSLPTSKFVTFALCSAGV